MTNNRNGVLTSYINNQVPSGSKTLHIHRILQQLNNHINMFGVTIYKYLEISQVLEFILQ